MSLVWMSRSCWRKRSGIPIAVSVRVRVGVTEYDLKATSGGAIRHVGAWSRP